MPGLESFRIGTYQIAYRWVDVYADPKETGGSFFFMPDDNGANARIRLGFDYEDIGDPWCALIHEALEFLLADLCCRYLPTNHFVQRASDIYQFHFDHNQFTEISARLGIFLWDIKKDFEAAFDMIQEEKKNG